MSNFVLSIHLFIFNISFTGFITSVAEERADLSAINYSLLCL